jgi:glycosyltransferase involved in cell wall biosynthesis
MTKYGLKVIKSFIDKETGRQLYMGDILETTSAERMHNILRLSLAEIAYVEHGKKGKKVMFHQRWLYKIGGIETANRQIAGAFPDHNLTFVFNQADQTQLLELAKTHDVIIDDNHREYETDVLILSNYDSAPVIIDRVQAKKVYQFIHADFKHLMEMPQWKGFKWEPHPRVDKVLAVSETAKKGLMETFGIESTVVPNILNPIAKKRLTFIVLSRATAEKGIDRVLKMVDRFEEEGKDFVLFLCSTIETLDQATQARIRNDEHILLIPPSPYSQELLRSADYLIQLSLNESYCYSVREALQMQVPCIVSNIPEFQKIIHDGKNGYILDDDLSNLDMNTIFNNVPKPEPYNEKVSPLWTKILKGTL